MRLVSRRGHDRECSGEPRDLRESSELSIVLIALGTYRRYESRGKRKSILWLGGQVDNCLAAEKARRAKLDEPVASQSQSQSTDEENAVADFYAARATPHLERHDTGGLKMGYVRSLPSHHALTSLGAPQEEGRS